MGTATRSVEEIGIGLNGLKQIFIEVGLPESVIVPLTKAVNKVFALFAVTLIELRS